jgi:hypothetical protein
MMLEYRILPDIPPNASCPLVRYALLVLENTSQNNPQKVSRQIKPHSPK